MTRVPFRYHQIESEGLWISPDFPAAERHHIKQGVIAGFLSGHPRWAEDLDGNFIYGLDAKGKEIKETPSVQKTPLARKVKQGHATKKSPAQLDREINEVLGGRHSAHTTKIVGAPGHWADKHFSEARTPRELTAVWGTMQNPFTGMGRYYATRSGVAQSEIKAIYRQHQARVGAVSNEHATVKRAIPGVAKWSMHAGGTSESRGRHGYTFRVPEGTYRINPSNSKFGRPAGYSLYFTAEGGSRPRGSHGGLWHDLANHRSPASAASAAAKHYAKGFE